MVKKLNENYAAKDKRGGNVIICISCGLEHNLMEYGCAMCEKIMN